MTCDHHWQYVKPWPWEEVFRDGQKVQHEGGEYWCHICSATKLMVYSAPQPDEPERWKALVDP